MIERGGEIEIVFSISSRLCCTSEANASDVQQSLEDSALILEIR